MVVRCRWLLGHAALGFTADPLWGSESYRWAVPLSANDTRLTLPYHAKPCVRGSGGVSRRSVASLAVHREYSTIGKRDQELGAVWLGHGRALGVWWQVHRDGFFV